MELHKSGEDYLENILILQKNNGEVRSVDIANRMGVSKASVSYAVSYLREGGFLIMDEDRFLHLTDKGRKVAERIYERHVFFTNMLIAAGVDSKIAEIDACQMEHVISEGSFDKLKNVPDNKKYW